MAVIMWMADSFAVGEKGLCNEPCSTANDLMEGESATYYIAPFGGSTKSHVCISCVSLVHTL